MPTNYEIVKASERKAFLHTQAVFIIGDFENREELRKGVFYPENPNPKAPTRWDWIEGTFDADRNTNETDLLRRVDDDSFFYHRKRNRTLLITRAIQEGLRLVSLKEYSGFPIHECGGITPYNHFLASKIRIDYGKGNIKPPSVLSVVVEEKPSLDFKLEDVVAAEFRDGVDIFLTGIRQPGEYLQLIRAWFSGTVNPNKYKNASFNPNRFSADRNGLLRPTHNYG